MTGTSLGELASSLSARLGDGVLARRVVEEAADLSPERLVLLARRQAPGEVLERCEEMAARLEAGEPLQHVLGHWSFRTLELAVDGRALVPRPETEVVTGLALDELDRLRRLRHGGRSGRHGGLHALDLGTGSGAIACSLASEAGDVRVVATDRSLAALSLAADNVAALPSEVAARIELAAGDWYSAVPPGLAGQVDVVVSNPPYLAEDEWARLDPVVAEHDPYEALVAGPSGLEAIEAVVAGAPALLAPGGSLVVELAPHQAAAVLALARQAGAVEATVERDLAGRQRALVARW